MRNRKEEKEKKKEENGNLEKGKEVQSTSVCL